MNFNGFELQYFRSIGGEPVKLSPLKKCNILVGQNNSGKSNVIRAIKKVSDRVNDLNPKFDELDLHQRSPKTPFICKLFFLTEENIPEDNEIRKLGFEQIWFEISWDTNAFNVSDNCFAHMTDFNQANQIFKLLSAKYWTQRVSADEIKKEFRNSGANYLNRYQRLIPTIEIIPEFRKIIPGENYKYDGENLIDLLGKYQMPEIGHDLDQLKFERIQEFTRKLLHMPKAILEVTRKNEDLIIKNEGLRLPLRSFGTGVHELIILVTATLAMDNKICCIEEPEIHLHPRLQRELINFLINETSNCYVISTHSPALINIYEFEQDIQIVHLKCTDGVTQSTFLLQNSQIRFAMQDLGLKASDLLQTNCIFWIEGPSDRNYLIRWIELLAPDLVEGRDFTFFYYSQNPKLNIDGDNYVGEMINVLAINTNVIYLTDSDRKSEKETCHPSKTDLAQKCQDSGGLGWITDGREIENYITSSVLEKFFRDTRKVEIEAHIGPFDKFSDQLDKIAKKAGVESINYNNCKKPYSQKLAELFSKEDIQGDLKTRVEQTISLIRKWNK